MKFIPAVSHPCHTSGTIYLPPTLSPSLDAFTSHLKALLLCHNFLPT